VATIIHAVSAALMSVVPAKAGVTNQKIDAGKVAANLAARHESAPIGVPHPAVDFVIADQAPLPGAMEAARG